MSVRLPVLQNNQKSKEYDKEKIDSKPTISRPMPRVRPAVTKEDATHEKGECCRLLMERCRVFTRRELGGNWCHPRALWIL